MLKIREAEASDLKQLLQLYTQLHNNEMPIINANLEEIWYEILTDKNHYIILGLYEEKVVSSCVIVIIRNLTNNQRPYALIENVVTKEDYRGRGYATNILEYAKSIAVKENCYKIMLLTGAKNESTLNFYKKAGYNDKDKTAFIQWI